MVQRRSLCSNSRREPVRVQRRGLQEIAARAREGSAPWLFSNSRREPVRVQRRGVLLTTSQYYSLATQARAPAMRDCEGSHGPSWMQSGGALRPRAYKTRSTRWERNGRIGK